MDFLAEELLEGVTIRSCHFQPTFQKHAGVICAGGQLHITDQDAFHPLRTAVAILRAVRALAPQEFRWSSPPYEYEENLMPIDLIWGHDGLRRSIDCGATVDEALEGVREALDAFSESAESFLIYE